MPERIMKPGYKISEGAILPNVDCIVIFNWPDIKEYGSYHFMNRTLRVVVDQYTTAIFRVKPKAQ
jgi:hypothetical protein